ncbi:MAG TPA: MFS transporter [Candidatus Acidoferrum sp.]|nr:MFS transporter [Candidatus Acidoferrum sp.]
MSGNPDRKSWLNRTVLGVGLTSLLADWSHEAATSILPAFLAFIGAGPAWLGAIEGISDGLSSFTKLAAGHYTDRWKKRKPIAVFGYAVTALATAAFAFTTHAYQLVVARSIAWLGRGVRSPAKKALLTADTPPWAYGRAFGLERLMDTVGAIAGPISALWLLEKTGHDFRMVFLWTLVPGLVAALAFLLLVRERPIERIERKSLLLGLRSLPAEFRKVLLGIGVFGAGDFSHSLLILYASRMLAPQLGLARAATIAIALYMLHNFFSAGSSYLSGWLSDHLPQRKLALAVSYGIAAVTALLLCTATHSLALLAVIFLLAGAFEGSKDALEDAVAASCAPNEQHGMAFGTLAAVNALGDFVSSLLVGALWSALNVQTAFGVSAALFLFGAILILRVR